MTEHKRSWRDFLTVHPAAEKWPLLAEAELRALGEDIKANGLRVPIVLHNAGTRGMLLIDGRNRLDAMELIGVETESKGIPSQLHPKIPIRLIDGDLWEATISLNAHRRHLTAEQKRELIATLLKAKPERSDRATAAIVGASDKTAAAVRADLERRSEIPNVSTRTDTAGRSQPVTVRKTAESPKRMLDKKPEGNEEGARDAAKSTGPVLYRPPGEPQGVPQPGPEPRPWDRKVAEIDEVFQEIRDVMRIGCASGLSIAIGKLQAYKIGAAPEPTDEELLASFGLANVYADEWKKLANRLDDILISRGIVGEKRIKEARDIRPAYVRAEP
jgi:ParB-like chromosome segregation protein Spo0J